MFIEFFLKTAGLIFLLILAAKMIEFLGHKIAFHSRSKE